MFNVKAEGSKLTIKIYSGVSSYGYTSWFDNESEERPEGGVISVADLEDVMKANKNASLIDIYINSPGGDVFEGIAIYNILKRNRAYKRVYIDGFACSIASVIAMAGNTVQMPKSSMMMIHNAWSYVVGNANDMRKAADDLDKINETIVSAYMSKFNAGEDKLRELLDAESYLTPEECVSYGLANKIVEDGEDTASNAEEAIEDTTTVYSAKLRQLETIKGALRTLNAETDEAETVKEAEAEIVIDAESVNEADSEMPAPENPIEATPEMVAEAVHEVEKNALHRFFHVA